MMYDLVSEISFTFNNPQPKKEKNLMALLLMISYFVVLFFVNMLDTKS